MIESTNSDPGRIEIDIPESRQPDSQRWRILVVAHGYPPLQMAGAEQQMRRKVNWWRERGHSVQVLAADPRQAPDYPFGQVDASDDHVDGVQVRRLRFAVADASRPLLETYRHPLLAIELDGQIRAFGPDVIYQASGALFGLLPPEMAARYGIPCVLFATDFWHLCQRHTLLRPDGNCCPGPRRPADCASCRVTARRPFQLPGRRFQAASWKVLAASGGLASKLPQLQPAGVDAFDQRSASVRQALTGIGLVICNSQFLAGVFADLGVERDRILTVRQGIEEVLLVPHIRSERTDGPLRVLYLGQVTRHKGVDLLVRATSRLIDEGVDLTLRIHGPITDGDFRIGNTKRGRIQLGSSLPYEGIFQALAESDVLVVPSRWYENSPNVILEAQSMCVPVVAADHGGMAEMVRHDVDGLLFKPGDAGSLVEALKKLASDRRLLNRLSANAVMPSGIDVEMETENEAIAALLTRATPAAVSNGGS